MRPFVYIVITIAGTVAGQLILKKGMMEVGQVPTAPAQFVPFFIKAFTNYKVVLSLSFAFVAALGWIAAVSRLDLSYAYPFMASTFAIVLILSKLFFHEEISLLRWVGVLVIWLGVFLVSRG